MRFLSRAQARRAGARHRGGWGGGGARVRLASTGGSPVVGHVYVNDNTGQHGRRVRPSRGRYADPSGGLCVLRRRRRHRRRPVRSGRDPDLAGWSVRVAVDAGSNQVSVLRIHPDGSLRLVRHGVVSSGGALPDSVAVHGDLVYVANSGNGGTNYTGFPLDPDGHLRPDPGFDRTLAADAAPADVLFNGTGTKLVGTRVGSSLIDSFTVGRDGLLTAAPDSPIAAQGLGPFGSEFGRPIRTSCSCPMRTTSARAPARSRPSKSPRTGRCRRSAGSPFADNQTAPCWIEITHDGQVLFTVNTGWARSPGTRSPRTGP